MSFQWGAVAGFLYAEIFFILLMMMPWIRPPIWAAFFRSRFMKLIDRYSYIYHYAVGGLLIVVFVDAIREVRKYSSAEFVDVQHTVVPAADTMVHMRLFRAQRNLYISGMTVFLFLVIRRMMQMLMQEAHYMASAQAALKQAQSASDAATDIIDQAGLKKEGAKIATITTDEMAALRKKLAAVEKDRDAMKEQAEGIKREFDRLMDEYGSLQKTVESGRDRTKKD